MISDWERTEPVKILIGEACIDQGIQPKSLTLHADNGPAMTAAGAVAGRESRHNHVAYAALWFERPPFFGVGVLDVEVSPRVPGSFAIADDARAFCSEVFRWYSSKHRHSEIAKLTTEMIHYQRDGAVLEQQFEVLAEAFQQHPERFVLGVPRVKELSSEV